MAPISTVQIMVDSGLIVLIWLVQLIIYPSFRYTEPKNFISWHQRYTGLIGVIVSPLMLLQVGVEVWMSATQDLRWIRIVLIAFIWISTFTLSVPCHRRLHIEGKNKVTIRRLIVTNWFRTLLWSLLFLDTLIRYLKFV